MTALETLLETFAAWRATAQTVLDDSWSSNLDTLRAYAVSDGAADLLFDAEWYAARHGLARRPKRPNLALEHYLGTGAGKRLDPTCWFDETFYCNAYADVRAGLEAAQWRCGYQHYLIVGMQEGRDPNPGFDELAYLGTNADVLAAVQSSWIPSAAIHFLHGGQAEGRSMQRKPEVPLLDLPVRPAPFTLTASSSFAEDIYRTANPDVAGIGGDHPGETHWMQAGVHEDLAGVRQRLTGWVENLYIRNNPDLGPCIGPHAQPTGYSHFLMYGATERRRWAGSDQAEREQLHLRNALSTRSKVPPELADGPMIAIIVPVYDTDLDALLACIDSVVTQTYPNWQLCLSDDASTLPHVLEVMTAARERDPRIVLAFAARNGGISAASNAALHATGGDFVALLDHDDILAPDALLHLARAIASAPDVDMVYTDEGKITEDGELVALSPKPGWSPELLLSTMYIGHLTAHRRSVVEAVGGFRSRFDGTQDYDLALRVSEVVRRVVHVPMPLYFWRMSPSSTAGSIGAKPGVLQLQRLALESALVRRGRSGVVAAGHAPGHWAVRLDPPDGLPLVSVVIPTAGRSATIGGVEVDMVVNCIHSLDATETYPNYEIVVVHNGDLRACTVQQLANYPRVRLVHYRATGGFNLSDKINLGVRAAAGSHVLLLNDDMQAESADIIRSMLGRMFEGVGVIGGRLLYANGTLQHAGVVWSAEGPTHAMIGEHRLIPGPAERLRITHNALAVSGACMFFQRTVFLDCGGFSPRLAVNYNDVDLCLTMGSRGLRVVFNPDVTMFHFESLSKSGTHFWELQLLSLSHPGTRDPFWNPTFSRSAPFYELRHPGQPEKTSYRAWLLARIVARQAGLTRSRDVRFSFVMSVYQNRKYQMQELAATVAGQTYDNWEWVIVDDGSTLPETLEWLEEAQSIPGVRFVRLPANGGIMAGYGAGFAAATGDYVVPIDADDFLTLDCLHVLATAIEAMDRPDVVYSDEDKGTESGVSHSPFLKPDWDPVLFTNICYVCHVCAVKRSTAEAVGAYQDRAASWCHDWDTLLRMKRAGARIEHVPEVLYHWRIHQGSTASIETGTKPHTIDSQRHVLEQDLRLTGADASFAVVGNELFPHDGIWRLKPLPDAVPPSMLAIVDTGVPGAISRLLGDLALTSRPADCLVALVGGEDMDAEVAALLPEVVQALWPEGRLLRFPGIAELAAACVAQDRLVAVVDAQLGGLNRSWLPEGLGMFAVAPDVGAVGGQVVGADGAAVWRGGFAGFAGAAGSPEYGRAADDSGYHGMGWCQRSCDSVPSICFFVRPDLLARAEACHGQPDSLRLLAGRIAVLARQSQLRVVYTPFVQVTLAKPLAVGPILPPDWADTFRTGPVHYPAAFGLTQATAYQLHDDAAG